MSKKKQPVEQDAFEAALKSEEVLVKKEINLDKLALSVVEREGGGFNIIGIKYDGKNLVAGEVEILDTADGRGEATEKFKILVVRNKLI